MDALSVQVLNSVFVFIHQLLERIQMLQLNGIQPKMVIGDQNNTRMDQNRRRGGYVLTHVQRAVLMNGKLIFQREFYVELMQDVHSVHQIINIHAFIHQL